VGTIPIPDPVSDVVINYRAPLGPIGTLLGPIEHLIIYIFFFFVRGGGWRCFGGNARLSKADGIVDLLAKLLSLAPNHFVESSFVFRLPPKVG